MWSTSTPAPPGRRRHVGGRVTASDPPDGQLRVLLVSPGFFPDRGGVEQHVTHLATELSTAGVQVEVLTARRGLYRSHTERHDGIRVRVLPAWRISSLSLSPRLALAALRAGRHVDLVHVHSYHASSGLAAFVATHTPVVLTPHYHGGGHTPLAVALHAAYRRMGASLLRAADAVVCVSRAEARALTHDFPAVAERIHVLPNGVDVQLLRQAQPFPDEPATGLVLGRLEPYKNVATMVAAVPGIDPVAQVVVIGEGSARAELEATAQRAGVAGRIRFLGALDTPTVHRWLRTARVLVSLSDHEAFGLAPLEAGVAGARQVLSDIPAHREISTDFLGPAALLVPVQPSAVATAVNAQLRQPDRVEIDAPDWASIALQTLAVYRTVHTSRTLDPVHTAHRTARRRGATP
jgi:glycosyltransferase involved in cell wall biosynthesis